MSTVFDYGLQPPVVDKLFCHSDEVIEHPWAATLASVMELQSFINTGSILNLNSSSFVTGLTEYFDSRGGDLTEFETNNCLNSNGYIHPKCIMTYLNQTHPTLEYNRGDMNLNLFVENVEKIELKSLDDFIELFDNDPMKIVYTGYNSKKDGTGIYTDARAIMSLTVDNVTGWVGFRSFNNQCSLDHLVLYNTKNGVFRDKYDMFKDMYAFKISEVKDTDSQVVNNSDNDSDSDSDNTGFKSATITLGVLLGVFVAGFFAVGTILLKKLNIICKNNTETQPKV